MSRSKRRRNNGTISIGIIVVAFLAIMAVQIVSLKRKDNEYANKQQDLQEQYEAETERAEELNDLEAYMKSDDYIEDTAKSKLGLVYDNEIIFKESGD